MRPFPPCLPYIRCFHQTQTRDGDHREVGSIGCERPQIGAKVTKFQTLMVKQAHQARFTNELNQPIQETVLNGPGPNLAEFWATERSNAPTIPSA